MNKKNFALLVVFILIFSISGCTKQSDENVIQPESKSISTPTLGIPLYFGYKNQDLLCAELREIPQSYESSIEQLAINELIKGPAGVTDLYPLIPADTSVRVSGVSDTLFVTLSSEFLDTMPGENKNFAKSETDLAAVMGRRRLAVYSIVNTVTEIGNYSRVQILISDKGTPSGYRPTMYDVGFSTNNNGKFLDTLPRSPEVVLTPQSAVSGIISLIQEKQWEDVYKCLYHDSTAGTAVSAYDFESGASKVNLVIENFSVNNNVTYNSNGVAIVNINFTIRTANGSTEYTQVPIRVFLVNNIWKADYSSVYKIFTKVS